MATVNAAKILKWDRVVGSIEPGKRADLLCVNGQQGDDYLRVIKARESSIALVIIDGVPRVGRPQLMKAFKFRTEDIEEIRVGRSERVLYLKQESAHSLVQDLTLTEATSRLRQAMRDLPALAAELDAAQVQGLFAGSEDTQGTTWNVVLDFEEEEDTLGLAALPFADSVQPMDLVGISVADDAAFLRRLVAARNLPLFLKTGLPALYGKSIPLPANVIDRDTRVAI
jgi:hypothetical protein